MDPGQTQTYSYDNLNRILTAQAAATSGADCWAQTFGNGTTAADDILGNLLNANAASSCPTWTLSVGVNSNNQINTPAGFTYDAAGNSTADGSYSYTYDTEGRIVTASGMTGGPYCYTYDGNGMRVMKANVSGGSCPATSQSQVDVLYWRSVTGDTIAETDGTGSKSNSNYHEYIFFGGRRIARSDPSTGNVYFYFVDQLGSTRAVAQWNAGSPSTDGTVCFSLDYYPYGQEVDYTTSCAQNYKFTGYERDAETGVDYGFARFYNTRMGRFMSPDPLGGAIGAPQSHNGYSYVVNDPCDLTDASGLTPCTINIDNSLKLLTSDQLKAMVNQLQGLLNSANADAQVTTGSSGTFNIMINQNAEAVNPQLSNTTTIGYTARTTGGGISNSGMVFSDALSNLGSSYNDYNPSSSMLGIGAARTGFHEFLHFVLQVGNSGHTPNTPFQASFAAEQYFSSSPKTSFVWRPTNAQIAAIQNLCGKKPKNRGGGSSPGFYLEYSESCWETETGGYYCSVTGFQYKLM